MYVQYSEGLPGAVLEEKEQRLFFNTGGSFAENLESFYQGVIEEDVDRFAISRDYALGLHLFLEKARSRGKEKTHWLKGQLTGPFSFAMTVVDQDKRSMAYHPELADVAVQGVALKARWIARQLRKISDNVLVTADEPYLCSFGSAFVNVPREQVVAAITATHEAIHKEGALAGLHCCGNTDWSLAFETPLDVLSFDAFGYFSGLPLYPAELKKFIERGGTLAWGIVPSTGEVLEQNAESLLAAFDQRLAELVAKGIDRHRLLRQSLITPSCGTGSQTLEVADRAMALVAEVSEKLRSLENLP
jgi:methionine synthase II (cobalamin-independent)